MLTSKNQLSRMPTRTLELENALLITTLMMTPFTSKNQELRMQVSLKVFSLRDTNCHSMNAITKWTREMLTRLTGSLKPTSYGRILISVWTLAYTREFSELLTAMISPEDSTLTRESLWTHQNPTHQIFSLTLELWSTWSRLHQIRLRLKSISKSDLKVEDQIRT